MRFRQIPTVCFLGGALAAWPASAQAPATEPTATAFVGVAVIPMDRERVLQNQTVVIQGNRIAAVGSAAQVPVPAGAQRIDGRGKFLIPGLADMHSHVSGLGGLFGYLANGVTTVHLEFSSRLQQTPEEVEGLHKYRELAARGELVPPRFYGRGDFPDCKPNAPFADTADTSMVGCIARIKAARLANYEPVPEDTSIHGIVHRVELGLEKHPPLTLADFEQALRYRWRYFDHLYTYLDYVIGHELPFISLTLGLDTAAWMQPGYRLDPRRLRTVVQLTRQAGTWNIPTQVALEEFHQTGGLFARTHKDSAEFHRVLQRRLEFREQIIKALSDAGAGLLVGADLYDIRSGFAVHRELQLFVEAGLTPYQALEAATRNVAVFTGTADSAGTIAVGKYADLVLLEGNPLQDIRYAAGPAGVMFNGRWLSRAEIDKRLDMLAAKGCRVLAGLRRAAWSHQGISREVLRRDPDINACVDF